MITIDGMKIYKCRKCGKLSHYLGICPYCEKGLTRQLKSGSYHKS